MRNRFVIHRIQILVILLGLSFLSKAQITSLNWDWADTTKYTKIGVAQDSIYVFFSTAASPKKGNLKAKLSDGANSNFKWHKYNSSISNVNLRFVEYFSEDGTQSIQSNLETGGYKVTVTKTTDPTIKEEYFCWVMIDEVVISGFEIYNGCDFLEIITKTNPSQLSLRNYNYFRYWDIKSFPTSFHGSINILGNDYFKNCVWRSAGVVISSASGLILTKGNPPPLDEATYDIQIINPFGRELKDTTDLLPANATNADFTVFIDEDGKNSWIEGIKGEAPLAIKFDTKSKNADSIYWKILNDPLLLEKGGDSIIWKQGYLLSEGIGITPPDKLVPGSFPVVHLALNLTSGCIDSMTTIVEVDTSFIKADAIPNVFTPNGDGENDFFLIKKPIEDNLASIKSFKISILSRQGLLVYSYSGDPKSWEGWDGKIERNKRDAPEGVYYFIIEAIGWDDKSFRRGPYKGFVYLYRGR